MSDKQTSTNSATSTGATNEAAPASPAAASAHSHVKMAQAMPVRVQLFNSSGATLAVPVINKVTGDTDIVFVQHGGKPKLTAGYTVDPVFASRHPSLQVTKVNN